VPVANTDNVMAIDQMETAYYTLISREVKGGVSAEYRPSTAHLALDGNEHPRLVTLGGDHTIVLPILRALNKVYGPVSVIHFDAHLDTWQPQPGSSAQGRITHGTFFHIAGEEGLIRNTSIHAGIRCEMRVGPCIPLSWRNLDRLRRDRRTSKTMRRSDFRLCPLRISTTGASTWLSRRSASELDPVQYISASTLTLLVRWLIPGYCLSLTHPDRPWPGPRE
ncbi:unnamed protein product, partial [Mycena citricolor]